MIKNGIPIKDEEFNLYLSQYQQKLEDEILKTGYGKAIKDMELLGIGMSMEEVINKYQEKNGYTIDNIGNIKVQEDSIAEIYAENIGFASKKIGFSLEGLDLKQISQVVDQLNQDQEIENIIIGGSLENRKSSNKSK